MSQRERRRLIYSETLRLFLSILTFAFVALLMMNLQILSDRAFHASILEENQLLLKKVRLAALKNDTKVMEERWQNIFRFFYQEAPLYDRGFYCLPDWSDSFPMLVDVALQSFIWVTFIIHFILPLPRCLLPWQQTEGRGSWARLKRLFARLPCFITEEPRCDQASQHPAQTAACRSVQPKSKCSWLFVKNRNRTRLTKLYRLVVVRRMFWIVAIIFLLRSFCFTSTAVPNPKPWCEYQYPKPNPSSILSTTANRHHDYMAKIEKEEDESCSAFGMVGCNNDYGNDKWKRETMDWLRILAHMMTGEASACTDNIFSGHAAITMTCLWTWLWYQRGPAAFQFSCRHKKQPKPASDSAENVDDPIQKPASPSGAEPEAPLREPFRVWSIYALGHAFLILFLIIATHLHYTVDVILSMIISTAIYYIYHFAVSYAESRARKERAQDGSSHHRFAGENLTFPWPYYLCAMIGWMDGVDLRVRRESEADEEEGLETEKTEEALLDGCSSKRNSACKTPPLTAAEAETKVAVTAATRANSGSEDSFESIV